MSAPSPRLLLVDDEPDFLESMEFCLRPKGYLVKLASGGEEALKIIKAEPPDIVFLDIDMPQMDGLETLRQIREFNKEIPVVMVTGYPYSKYVVEADQLGISGFLPKDADISEMTRMIETLLKRHRDLPGGHPEKVLVVDDDQEVRSSIEKILTRKGYQVTTVSSGHQALEEITKASFNLVLLDMMMPLVSGLQVYQAIRLVPDLKVIVMTDPKEPAERMVEEVKKLGAQGTLLKPVGEKELGSIVEGVLRERKSEVKS